MLTVKYDVFVKKFAEQTRKVRLGHAVMIIRYGMPYFILAHPSLLSDEESINCERIASTHMYSLMARKCFHVDQDKTKLLITNHGRITCCIVPVEFAERALEMDRGEWLHLSGDKTGQDALSAVVSPLSQKPEFEDLTQPAAFESEAIVRELMSDLTVSSAP